jgi:hypothetical protein
VFSRPFQGYPNISLGKPNKKNMHSNSSVLDVPHLLMKYRSLIAGSAQNNYKNRCLKLGILLAYLLNIILVVFQNCQKVRNFYFSLEFYLHCKHV